ncbi:galactose-specific lectin nattectin-like [Megalobrama amblycephala]|uniref:galactose-specific lectin nattectin-like n=1 Tax=Megalobrama amblycephala TaxID=75352 RepID=UPI0020142AD7|nr:galactose-specific lectin nattectin-like [Megalobrama amblycephala]XP_048015916.1 galactose-specific lectin nattectin-like [Megalobrama amblycephala]
MALWTVYLSLGLLVALNASVETHPVGNKLCSVCTEGWTAYGCRCFKFFSNLQTWTRAEKACLDYDGNLASVHNHLEYMFLQNLIRHATQGAPKTWIGGSDAAEEGVWFWSDGTKMNYQIWSPGEPNNNYNEDCLEMNFANGNWNDEKCHEKRPFMCVK